MSSSEAKMMRPPGLVAQLRARRLAIDQVEALSDTQRGESQTAEGTTSVVGSPIYQARSDESQISEPVEVTQKCQLPTLQIQIEDSHEPESAVPVASVVGSPIHQARSEESQISEPVEVKQKCQLPTLQIQIEDSHEPESAVPIAQTYEFLHTLGEGKHGSVRAAVNNQTGERVAIKVINKMLLDNRNHGDCMREVQCMQLIEHPNVQRVHEVVETAGHLYIVITLASGGDLYDRVSANGKLPESEARPLFKQLILGLEACHKAGVCHRDLKPENILLSESTAHSGILVSDFGLANRFSVAANGDETLLRTPCGSSKYAAPEVLLPGKLYIPSAIDIWSAGVVLFVCCAGMFPFIEASRQCGMFRQHAKQNYRYPSGMNPKLIHLFNGMLCIDSKRRWNIEQIKQSEWWNELEAEAADSNQCPSVCTTKTKEVSFVSLVDLQNCIDENHCTVI